MRHSQATACGSFPRAAHPVRLPSSVRGYLRKFANHRANDPDAIRLTRSDHICSPIPRLDPERLATWGKISGAISSADCSTQHCLAVLRPAEHRRRTRDVFANLPTIRCETASIALCISIPQLTFAALRPKHPSIIGAGIALEHSLPPKFITQSKKNKRLRYSQNKRILIKTK